MRLSVLTWSTCVCTIGSFRSIQKAPLSVRKHNDDIPTYKWCSLISIGKQLEWYCLLLRNMWDKSYVNNGFSGHHSSAQCSKQCNKHIWAYVTVYTPFCASYVHNFAYCIVQCSCGPEPLSQYAGGLSLYCTRTCS